MSSHYLCEEFAVCLGRKYSTQSAYIACRTLYSAQELSDLLVALKLSMYLLAMQPVIALSSIAHAPHAVLMLILKFDLVRLFFVLQVRILAVVSSVPLRILSA
jgi:hypothetical protein